MPTNYSPALSITRTGTYLGNYSGHDPMMSPWTPFKTAAEHDMQLHATHLFKSMSRMRVTPDGFCTKRQLNGLLTIALSRFEVTQLHPKIPNRKSRTVDRVENRQHLANHQLTIQATADRIRDANGFLPNPSPECARQTEHAGDFHAAW